MLNGDVQVDHPRLAYGDLPSRGTVHMRVHFGVVNKDMVDNRPELGKSRVRQCLITPKSLSEDRPVSKGLSCGHQ